MHRARFRGCGLLGARLRAGEGLARARCIQTPTPWVESAWSPHAACKWRQAPFRRRSQACLSAARLSPAAAAAAAAPTYCAAPSCPRSPGAYVVQFMTLVSCSACVYTTYHFLKDGCVVQEVQGFPKGRLRGCVHTALAAVVDPLPAALASRRYDVHLTSQMKKDELAETDAWAARSAGSTKSFFRWLAETRDPRGAHSCGGLRRGQGAGAAAGHCRGMACLPACTVHARCTGAQPDAPETNLSLFFLLFSSFQEPGKTLGSSAV